MSVQILDFPLKFSSFELIHFTVVIFPRMSVFISFIPQILICFDCCVHYHHRYPSIPHTRSINFSPPSNHSMSSFRSTTNSIAAKVINTAKQTSLIIQTNNFKRKENHLKDSIPMGSVTHTTDHGRRQEGQKRNTYPHEQIDTDISKYIHTKYISHASRINGTVSD